MRAQSRHARTGGQDGGPPLPLPAFRSPAEIQDFVSAMAYDDAPGTASPLRVLHEGKANCFEGALFAAAALRRIGYPPRIVDLRAVNDDDHVVAVFRHAGHWGAVAKSNTTTLRYREPIHRTLREIAVSYFEHYFNIHGVKSLRSFSRPLDLGRFEPRSWTTTDEDLGYIGDELDRMAHLSLVSPGMIRGLRRAEKDQIEACFLGAVVSGLYQARAPGQGDAGASPTEADGPR